MPFIIIIILSRCTGKPLCNPWLVKGSSGPVATKGPVAGGSFSTVAHYIQPLRSDELFPAAGLHVGVSETLCAVPFPQGHPQSHACAVARVHPQSSPTQNQQPQVTRYADIPSEVHATYKGQWGGLDPALTHHRRGTRPKNPCYSSEAMSWHAQTTEPLRPLALTQP